MSSPETTALRQRLVRVIAHHAGSSPDSRGVAAAARRTYEELNAVLTPLISSSGVEALMGRAFDIAQNEYPADERRSDNAPSDEPFGRVSRWLERQTPAAATDAAAALFARFAAMLTTLIGEPLTTKYLEKAWPDGYAETPRKGNRT